MYRLIPTEQTTNSATFARLLIVAQASMFSEAQLIGKDIKSFSQVKTSEGIKVIAL